jgi:four helix bundle protein
MHAVATTHKDLIVWQVAMDLVVAVYKVCRALPRDELYGLVSQLRRAAVSVAVNIAEGSARTARGDFLHFLSIARGSLRELECLLEIVARLGFLTNAETDNARQLAARVGRLLSGLRKSLVSRSPTKHQARSTKSAV